MGRNDYRTPDWLFLRLETMFGRHTLDAAATPENTKCVAYYSEDGEHRDWHRNTFGNPPYSDHKGKACVGVWVQHAIEQWMCAGCRSTLVLPVGCSQRWFLKLLKLDDASIWYPERRINFCLPNGDPTRSADRDTIIVRIDEVAREKVGILTL